MNIIEEALSHVAGGKVLDVATHEGHFIRTLMKNLRSYTQIVGIDVDQQAIKAARETMGLENVQFLIMNAERLDFKDKSFDTVSISASLHHLSDIQRVLAEMERALKPQGTLILAEMHQDGQTDAELTSVYLHHWVADVDSALGGLHHHTLSADEITDYVMRLGMSQVNFYPDSDRDSDPMDRKTIEQLDEFILNVYKRAEKAASLEILSGREKNYINVSIRLELKRNQYLW